VTSQADAVLKQTTNMRAMGQVTDERRADAKSYHGLSVLLLSRFKQVLFV
jgi:hypothetical protein